MEFKVYEDANEFAEKAEPILSKKEDIYSLFFGVLQAIKAGRYEKPFMATIEEDEDVIALIQMTPPHALNFIIVDENRLDAIIDCLVENLISFEINVPSIVSLKPWAYSFAKKWKMKTGLFEQIVMDQGLYRIDQVDETLERSPGNWRLADEGDCPLIENWYNMFEEDANLPLSPLDDVRKRVALFVTEREVFLWEYNGKVVSMMKKARPTKHGVTVSFVFTPREERKKGFARTLVAEGTKELLKEYNFCVLYTDMMNPTSNKIYMEIGYVRIADSVQLAFILPE